MNRLGCVRWIVALIGVITVGVVWSPAVARDNVMIEKVNYKGWKNNLRVSNGEVELILTLDVGPRVIHYGFVGGKNVFKQYSEQLGRSGEDKWQIRGGHR